MNKFWYGLRNGLIISFIMWAIILAFGFVAAHADNSARIQELTTEAKGLIEKQGQYTQAVRQIEARLFEINGAVNELKLQDAPKTTGTGG